MTTAALSTFSGIRYTDTHRESDLHVDLLKRYYRMLVFKAPEADLLETPRAHQASLPLWLEDVVRRINDSVAPRGMNEELAGRWLSEPVAEAARQFLLKHASLLPSEPHIYSSADGELVAEFQGRHGMVTSIVSPEFLVLFASVNGHSVYWRSSEDETGSIKALTKMKNMLETGKHGDMETRL